MSLRNQISIRILLISLGIIFLGAAISIWQARQSIKNEVDSSINLALQLIKTSPTIQKSGQKDWLLQLSQLEQTRHLNIQLKNSLGKKVNEPLQPIKKTTLKNSPPVWFTNLVLSEYPKVEYPVDLNNNTGFILIIQANPMDEVAEAWQESIIFFGVIIALVSLTLLSAQLVFNKSIISIHSIIAHLKTIETGNYHKKLPAFSTQEYDTIAKAINHMTEALETSEKQNKALTQHSLEIQESERKRLSQELHDELGQSLTAIKAMAISATHETADIQEVTTSIVNICDHLTVVVRSMMKQLHPALLTELGLKATLEDLLHQWQARSPSIAFTLHCDDAVDQVAPNTVIQVFRIIQEGLTNIIRHARATQVSVKIQLNQGKLILLVTDNGCGCESDKLTSGFGLLGIKERIKLLEGSLQISSKIDNGLQLKAQIPLS